MVEVKYEDFTWLDIGKFNYNYMIIGGMGTAGKTMTTETLVEELRGKGYVAVYITDRKKNFENAYSMFEPKEHWHLKSLEIAGKKKCKENVKIYHPYSFNIPKTELPKMELFTFNIKKLIREDFCLLFESTKSSGAINLMQEAQKMLGKDESWIELLHYAEERTKTHSKFYKTKNIAKSNKESLYLDVGSSGKQKAVSDLLSFLKPFLVDYMIAQESCPLNLDVKKMLNDREHLHVISTRYIEDDKMDYFTTSAFLNAIHKYLVEEPYVKYPVVIIIEEVRDLCPRASIGYTQFMALSIARKLSKIRNQGAGVSVIMTTQVQKDIASEVKNSANVTLIGNLGAPEDIENISKTYKYSSDVVKQLEQLRRGSYFVRTRLGKKTVQQPMSYHFLPPSHGHKEENYNFFRLYKEYGYEFVNYKKEIKMMQELMDKSMDNVRKKKEGKEKRVKEGIDKEVEETGKAEKYKQQLDDKVKEIKAQKGVDKNKRNEEIINLIEVGELEDGEMKKLSYSEVGEKFSMTKQNVGEIYRAYLKKKKTEEDLPDIKPAEEGAGKYDD